jgi:putative acetyltransferase
MPSIHIRNFRLGDEAVLRAVFHASVHGLASQHYTPEQCDAWAPLQHDAAQWAERMRANQPFVAQVDDSGAIEGAIAGFADLQPTGTIEMFFVAPAFAGQGVARALMAHIHAQAAQRGITPLHADVSLAAEPFFAACGFVVQARQQVERHGMVLRNARMAKALAGR